MSHVTTFASLFQGRTDAYGTDTGGCERDWPYSFIERCDEHLHGWRPVGVYPLTDRGVVWGCTDLDYTDDPTEAWMIALGLRHVGLNGWVERSRSKGFHVWSFAAGWVPAPAMRRTFLAVHQRLGIEAREVNPKQTDYRLDRLGNYVRLPYPAGWTAANRQVMIQPDGTTVPFMAWLTQASAAQSDPEQYVQAATLWQPPPPKRQVTAPPAGGGPAEIAARAGKTTFLAWKYGPRDGHDRSASLARLAHLCRRDDLSEQDAIVLVADLDDRLGKFVDRPNRVELLARIVGNAYR